jgi:hypothetical protein
LLFRIFCFYQWMRTTEGGEMRARRRVCNAATEGTEALSGVQSTLSHQIGRPKGRPIFCFLPRARSAFGGAGIFWLPTANRTNVLFAAWSS